jgi:hypothetical protein
MPSQDRMSPADFARERHAGQLRKGTDLPYVVHPEGVARILTRLYPGNADLEAAGWLHDVLEDTATTPAELETRFGANVRRLVEAVTKTPGVPVHLPTDPDAMRLKAADALDNVALSLEGLARGETVFERFKTGVAKVEYWRAIADATDGIIGGEPLASELSAAVGKAETYAREAARSSRS